MQYYTVHHKENSTYMEIWHRGWWFQLRPQLPVCFGFTIVRELQFEITFQDFNKVGKTSTDDLAPFGQRAHNPLPKGVANKQHRNIISNSATYNKFSAQLKKNAWFSAQLKEKLNFLHS